MSPRTGRRPGSSTSREEILRSAARLFAERGYDGATLRAIAADAGVDASLVVHFFGNKPALLAAAVEWPFDPDVEMPNLFVDGRSRVGEHLVELFVRTWDDEGSRNPILTLLWAASAEPRAAELLRDLLRVRVLEPLMSRLSVDQEDLRAELVVSQLIGLGMTRYVLRFEPLSCASPEGVVAWVGPTVQRYLTGELAS